MDAGWLQQGAVKAIGTGLLRLKTLDWVTLAAIAATLVLLALAVRMHRRRRRADIAEAIRLDGETHALKLALRARLEEPSELLGGAVAPTLGASEAFERDIEAAARTVLQEAGGVRRKAKELLRARLGGNGGGAQSLNGTEAAYWRQLGALSMLESTGDALRAYIRAAELAPHDAEAQMQAGVLNLRARRLPMAETFFRRHIELGNGAGAASGLRYRGQIMLGDVQIAREDRAGALGSYEAARAEVLRLLQQDPASAGLRRDLSMTCDRIGDVHVANGNRDAAYENYRKGLDAAEALAASDPHNAAWQHDLSVSYDRVGGILQETGDLDAAFETFCKGLTVAKGLIGRDAANPQWQWDLSTSYDRLGDIHIEQGRLDEALASYREGLTIAEALVQLDPQRIGWQRDLAASYHRIGLLEAQRGNLSEARESLERGRRIIARLERIASHQAQWRADLSRFDAALMSIRV